MISAVAGRDSSPPKTGGYAARRLPAKTAGTSRSPAHLPWRALPGKTVGAGRVTGRFCWRRLFTLMDRRVRGAKESA